VRGVLGRDFWELQLPAWMVTKISSDSGSARPKGRLVYAGVVDETEELTDG
jgi:hypothetical protein